MALDLVVGVVGGLIAFGITEAADVGSATLRWGIIACATVVGTVLMWRLGRRGDLPASVVSVFGRGKARDVDVEDLSIDPPSHGRITIADDARAKGVARFRNIKIGKKPR